MLILTDWPSNTPFSKKRCSQLSIVIRIAWKNSLIIKCLSLAVLYLLITMILLPYSPSPNSLTPLAISARDRFVHFLGPLASPALSPQGPSNPSGRRSPLFALLPSVRRCLMFCSPAYPYPILGGWSWCRTAAVPNLSIPMPQRPLDSCVALDHVCSASQEPLLSRSFRCIGVHAVLLLVPL